jgi:hypothetical protein
MHFVLDIAIAIRSQPSRPGSVGQETRSRAERCSRPASRFQHYVRRTVGGAPGPISSCSLRTSRNNAPITTPVRLTESQDRHDPRSAGNFRSGFGSRAGLQARSLRSRHRGRGPHPDAVPLRRKPSRCRSQRRRRVVALLLYLPGCMGHSWVMDWTSTRARPKQVACRSGTRTN